MAYFPKRAGDLDMIAIHNKAGASGVINDMITGDTQASFLNVSFDRRAGARRQAQADRGRQSRAACRLSGRADDGGSRLPGCRDRRVERHVRTGRHTQARARDVAQGRRRGSGGAGRKGRPLTKQNFNIVPSKSVDEAKAWLAGEIATWQRSPPR